MHGPNFAIDGSWSATSQKLYISKSENMPWFQWTLPEEANIIGVSISDEQRISPPLEVSLEVRAGMASIEHEFTGRIFINQLCGNVSVYGFKQSVYTVICQHGIQANYLTIQLIGNDVRMRINELELIMQSEGMP